MTPLQKADHLVRNHPANKELIELGFGCEVEYTPTTKDSPYYKARIIFSHKDVYKYVTVVNNKDNKLCTFNPGNIEKIFGKPPHLEHYLRVLEDHIEEILVDGGVAKVQVDHKRIGYGTVYTRIFFNLTTGAPATEKDAEEFIKIINN